jgi:hypothetical protein
MALAELLGISGTHDPSFLRDRVKLLAEELVELDVTRHAGAQKGESTPDHAGYKNGYREGRWDTRVGSVDLKVPGGCGMVSSSLVCSSAGAALSVPKLLWCCEAYVESVSARRADTS